MKKKAYGFTIVELLIVIVVIAILAAISIVAYRGIQDRANDSSARSAARQAATKLQVAFAENDTYPASLSSIGITNAGSTTYQYKYNNTVSPSTFCVTATTNNKSYYVSNTTTTPTEGGCSGHGVGGVEAITNLAVNPASISGTTRWAGWAGSSGGFSSHTTVAAPWASRGRTQRVTWSTTTTGYNGDLGYNVPSTGDYALRPNTQYTASWKVRVSKSQRIEPSISLFRVAGGADHSGTGTRNSSTGPLVMAPNTTYDQYLTFTTGANTTSAKIYSTLTPGTGATYWQPGDYLETTDFMLVEGSTVYSYADGTSPSWEWNGPQDNSSSTGPPL